MNRAGSNNHVVYIIQARRNCQTHSSAENRVRWKYSDQEGSSKKEESIGGPCSSLFNEEVEDIRHLCEVVEVVDSLRLMIKRVQRY